MSIEQLPRDWDAIIIGAGPAGAVSALQLSRAGQRVLLLERAAWPREKVCGGCVNADAIAMLRSIGIELPRSPAINRCVIHSNAQSAAVSVPPGVAIDRKTFDTILVDAAMHAGCTFVDSVSAVVSNLREEASHVHAGLACVHVTHGAIHRALRSGWVLVCDGINGSSLSQMPWATWTIAEQSHIGVATTLPGDAMDLPSGEIHMHVNAAGYVGGVRQADGSVHLAAALDPQMCRSAGSPGVLAAGVLRGRVRVDVASLRWSGTGKLTRRRQRLGQGNVLVVGDACGYVEPFTGQGIAWAIESAMEATSMLIAAAPDCPLAARWEAIHARTVRRHQWGCRAVKFSLRRPTMVKIALHAISAWPAIPQWITSPNRAIA